jgi:hypothetical protein
VAHIFGALIGTAVGTVVANEVHKGRERAALARRLSPHGRLGLSGIASLRYYHAAEDVYDMTCEAGDWFVLRGARLGRHEMPFVVISDDWAVVVNPMIGADHVGGVRAADEAAAVLTAWTAPDPLPVTSILCRADTEDEPRDVPGPSGGTVTITGLPWLTGVLRQRIGAVDRRTPGPESLDEPFTSGSWRSSRRYALYWAAVGRLPARDWWVVPRLMLDDAYPEPVDLLLAGPNGVFVVELSKTGAGDCADRVAHNAQRLRGYLPAADVVPVVVSDSVTTPRFGPADLAGNPIAWLHQDGLLDFVCGTRRRGVGWQEVGVLNNPGTGYYRRVVPDTDGAPIVQTGWPS